jgi:transposase
VTHLLWLSLVLRESGLLTGEQVMEIRILHKQGKSIHAIARDLSVSRGTVRKYLRQPELWAVYGPRKGRVSKLDPFKDYLRDRIRNAAPRRLPATVYLRELRALGYDGGITILKDWLLSQRPVQETPAIIRFETPPGKQAQVDWTSIRRGKNKLSAFVGTLGFPSVPIRVRHNGCSSLYLRVQENEPMVMPSQACKHALPGSG